MNIKKKHNYSSQHSGSTLLDAVLALFVLGFMIVLVGTFISARETNRRVLFRAQAAALADEQLNALRRLDVTTLSNQTDGAFKNTLYNAGHWRIAVDGDQVLELVGATGFSGLISGRLLFPAGYYADATLQADWKIMADSPAGWAFGYSLRAIDEQNRYRLRIAATGTDLDGSIGGNQNLILEKLVSGAATKIHSAVTSVAIGTGTTYTVKVVMLGSSIQMFINGNQQGVAPSDSAFTGGQAALLGGGGIHAVIDDVQTIAATTETWNFEASLDLPAAWVRLGLNNLPDSTATTFDDNGLLTISTYPVGSSTTTLKQATITVRWLTNGGLQNYTTNGLLGRSGVGL